MKKNILNVFIAALVLIFSHPVSAQTSLVEDQNPNFDISRAKYMQMADSITAWHSTTPQETYKAIDYMEDRRIEKEERQAFRRELRLERARRDNGWYYNDYDNYYQPQYRNRGYNRSYRYRSGFNNNYYNNTLPLFLMLGLLCR